MELFIIVVLAVALFLNWQSNKRIAALEKRIELFYQHFSSVSKADHPIDEPIDVTEKENLQPEAVVEPVLETEVETLDEPVSPWTIPEQPAEQAVTSVPKAFVFTPEVQERIVAWAKNNWFYLIAAISLATAGIFLIQYGVESGLLSPSVRVTFAILLGAALIGSAEYLRRRGGDEEGDFFAYLPSTLAGAGAITLFGAVWGAFSLYDLIGAEVAFVALCGLGVLIILMGWFYGPFLSALGIVGAMAAPFLIGGESEQPYLLNYYFAIVAIVGLVIDAVKRWAWLSVLALGTSFAAVFLVYSVVPSAVHVLVFSGLLSIAIVIVPMQALTPRHGGATVLGALISAFKSTETVREWPEFPTRLVWSAIAVSSAISLFVLGNGVTAPTFWLSFSAMCALLLGALLWMRSAEALADVVLLPLAAFLGFGVLVENLFSPYARYVVNANAADATATPDALGQPFLERPVVLLTTYMIAALVVGMIAAWRSVADEKHKLLFTGIALTFAPLSALLVHIFWNPEYHLGASVWAVYLVVIAVFMAMMVQRYVTYDGVAKERLSYALVSAFLMTSFALVTLFSSASLTLALAVMTIISIYLDKKYDLPILVKLSCLGIIVVGGRLIIYPGLLWSIDASLWEIVVAYGGVIGLFVGSLILLKGRSRPTAHAYLESAVWSLGAVFVSALIVQVFGEPADKSLHWWAGLYAFVWLTSAAIQLYRMKVGGQMQRLRKVLFTLYTLIGGAFLAVGLFLTNPLMESGQKIIGPIALNSLLIVFGLPALVFGLVALKFEHISSRNRRIYGVFAAFLTALYVGASVRHAWRGADISLPDMSEGELYSYTVLMLIIFGPMLVFALMRQSHTWRKIAMLGLALTSAKVFLIDASGLDGLIRVVSFLALGLILAGLAWLNQRFGAHIQDDTAVAPESAGAGPADGEENT